jgi:esterase
MQTLSVNGYDMAYLEIGTGRPLVCVHGTLGDFRTWSAVLGPLSKDHRVISVSLRHFFPEHWDGVGDDYLMVQHVADVIGFLEKLGDGPVNLMGHSRGGHIAFRTAQLRPTCCTGWCWPSPAASLTPRSIQPRPLMESRNARRGSRLPRRKCRRVTSKVR